MTEAEARAIPIGGGVRDNGPGVGTVVEKHIDFFSILWTAPPTRVEGVSTFFYEDCKLLQSDAVKTGNALWGSWASGDGYVGAMALDGVSPDDIIFISLNGISGQPWASLDWLRLTIGSKLKIWDGASTVWQYWTCTNNCAEVFSSRYEVYVSGTLLTVPPVDSPIVCTHEYAAARTKD